MPKHYKFRIGSEDGETPEFEGEFTDDEWSTLQRFCRFFDELSETELMKGGMNYGFTFKWVVGSGGSVDTSRFPRRADVREFLHVFRPIILQSEPTYFPKVLGILAQRAPHRGWRLLSDRFSGKRLRGAFRVVMVAGPEAPELTINSQATLDKWLNAYEYHRDLDYEAEFEALESPQFPAADTIRGMMLELLREKAAGAAALRALIQTFDQGKGASITIR